MSSHSLAPSKRQKPGLRIPSPKHTHAHTHTPRRGSGDHLPVVRAEGAPPTPGGSVPWRPGWSEGLSSRTPRRNEPSAPAGFPAREGAPLKTGVGDGGAGNSPTGCAGREPRRGCATSGSAGPRALRRVLGTPQSSCRRGAPLRLGYSAACETPRPRPEPFPPSSR